MPPCLCEKPSSGIHPSPYPKPLLLLRQARNCALRKSVKRMTRFSRQIAAGSLSLPIIHPCPLSLSLLDPASPLISFLRARRGTRVFEFISVPSSNRGGEGRGSLVLCGEKDSALSRIPNQFEAFSSVRGVRAHTHTHTRSLLSLSLSPVAPLFTEKIFLSVGASRRVNAP